MVTMVYQPVSGSRETGQRRRLAVQLASAWLVIAALGAVHAADASAS
jgi:hypothetical protein